MTMKKLPAISLPKNSVAHLADFLGKFTDTKIFIKTQNHEGEHIADGKTKFNLLNISLEGKTLSEVICHSPTNDEDIVSQEIVNWFDKLSENA